MSTPDKLATIVRDYDIKVYDFMAPQGPHMPVTENYVCIPPALYIREAVDNEYVVWTLGFDYDEIAWRGGKWEYDVIRDGRKTGAFARIIEKRNNSKGQPTVFIWGSEGWRQWNGSQFV